MGVVYDAEDTRLKRRVALKFLPPELTRDDESRQRFMQEAQAASALDHPHICTIYEIDSAPDGQLFIAMAFYDGETLLKRLQRGPLPVDEAVDIAVQIAQGLAKAHEAGIVHRDIKPANVMVTKDGLVKILDFGIAKLVGQTGPTRTGTTLGTVAYMAPEQISGGMVDQQSDLWSLGAVLYEMLTGRQAFQGDHEFAAINAILNRDPQPVRSLRQDVSGALEHVLKRSLAKRREERYPSMAEVLKDLTEYRNSVARPTAEGGGHATLKRAITRPAVAVPGLLALVMIGILAGWSFNRSAQVRWARETGIPEVRRLVEKDDYAAALALAQQVERIVPDDPALADLWSGIGIRRAVNTDPSGADVYIKGYADLLGQWNFVGRTPISDPRLPNGVFRWKIQKEGFDTVEFIAVNQFIPLSGQMLRLTPIGSAPGMLLVPASDLSLTLTGYNYQATIPGGAFLIDKYEVTNKEFKAFVDSGGYGKSQYWTHQFVKNGRILAWEQGIAEFRDRTGRPGPSTWEVGTYPLGQDNYPVAGVSWYEAAAYAAFAGKSLPTAYHWLRAAGVEAAAQITPLSNFAGKGTAPVGSNPGVGPVGAFDMAGNVKEWCWNEMASGSTRYILGGAWNDPSYQFIYADARPPFDRSETNGFRLVKHLDEKPLAEALTKPIENPSRDYSKEKPVSNEVFQVYKSLYSYDPLPLETKSETVDKSAEHWIREKISFRASYGGERVIAYVFLPKNVPPPYQAVVFFPGSDAIRRPSSETPESLHLPIVDFLMISGRAVIYPVYKGTYERNTTGQTSSWPVMNRAYRDLVMQQINDARRSVDYLETRADIRHDAIAYYGFSWGARLGSLAVAVDSRFKTAVFLDGGLPAAKAPPEVDPFNFAPHVSIPVLMLNGDSDFIYEVDTGQKPLFTRLGTTQDRKRHVIYPGGHGSISQLRSRFVKDTLDWLDRYLGPAK